MELKEGMYIRTKDGLIDTVVIDFIMNLKWQVI